MGLAIPGPYQRYGVLGRAANLPAAFDGWNFHEDYSRALAAAAGRAIPLVVGNDGKFGGVAEAKLVRAGKKASVLMLAPGSGLGCAYIDANGLPLDGETLAGMEAAHMPAPLQLLGHEAASLRLRPDLGLHRPTRPFPACPTWWRRSLRASRAPAGDVPAFHQGKSPFHSQPRPKGRPSRSRNFRLPGACPRNPGCDALPRPRPGFVVVGGGLMDHQSTTPEFRERYINVLRESAMPYLWPAQRASIKFAASELGELSHRSGPRSYPLYTSKAP